MPKVIITARYFAVDPEPLEVLQARGCMLVQTELDWTLGDGNVSEAWAVELLQDVDGAIISSLPLTDAVLVQTPSLKVTGSSVQAGRGCHRPGSLWQLASRAPACLTAGAGVLRVPASADGHL